MKNYLSAEALSEPCVRNLVLAPIVGFLFCMFLPLIGYMLVMKALFTKASTFVMEVFGPKPLAAGNAYLTGSPESDNLSSTDKLSEIAKEIDAKRK